jgi:hypothetical protein
MAVAGGAEQAVADADMFLRRRGAGEIAVGTRQ